MAKRYIEHLNEDLMTKGVTGFKFISGGTLSVDLADFCRRCGVEQRWERLDGCFKAMLYNGWKQKAVDGLPTSANDKEREEHIRAEKERVIDKLLWKRPSKDGGKRRTLAEVAIAMIEENIAAIAATIRPDMPKAVKAYVEHLMAETESRGVQGKSLAEWRKVLEEAGKEKAKAKTAKAANADEDDEDANDGSE